MGNKKVLFIVHNRKDRSPGQRFRFEQYIQFLEQHNFECTFSILLNSKDDAIFYSKGNFFKKLFIVFKGFLIRMNDLFRIKQYDIVFVFREAFFLGTHFFEKQFRKRHSRIIFDFDDAIWIDNVSDSNKVFSFLKDAAKTSKLISYADLVFAGNEYLKNYALKYNSNVVIVPTTIDTAEYQKMEVKKTNKICIGWSGSITTIKHFEFAVNFLKKVKEKYPDLIEIKVIGDANYINKDLNITGMPWNKQREIEELSSFDIGIMPLPDDEWAKGKCGLKGLQYMALEIPTIMSPVGVNSEIIKDGENGFLASTDEEWLQKLSLLIESKDLRERIGKAGRTTVLEKYSVESHKEKYLMLFNSLLEK